MDQAASTATTAPADSNARPVRGPEPYVVADRWGTAALPGLLRREIETDDPSGQVVIDRLLDLLVVGVVRRWAAAPERVGQVSGLASADPVVAVGVPPRAPKMSGGDQPRPAHWSGSPRGPGIRASSPLPLWDRPEHRTRT